MGNSSKILLNFSEYTNFNDFMISLSNEGFQNIDAVDGSLAMLEKLKEKNIYGKVYQAVLGKVLVQKS